MFRRAAELAALTLLLAGAGLLGLAPVGEAAQPADVEALMAQLGRVQRVEVDYQETIESGLITAVISTRGQLVYEAPDRIRRLSDRGEGFVLNGERMQLVADGRVVSEVELAGYAPLEAMVGALRAVFAGDLATLRAAYRLDYAPAASHWTLHLAPRGSGLSDVLQRIALVGDGATITTIAIAEPDGDQRTLRMQLRTREPTGLE